MVNSRRNIFKQKERKKEKMTIKELLKQYPKNGDAGIG